MAKAVGIGFEQKGALLYQAVEASRDLVVRGTKGSSMTLGDEMLAGDPTVVSEERKMEFSTEGRS